MTLGDYLAEAGRRPWRDGEHDCATFPAGWVVACGHPDPMAGWRGRYADPGDAQILIGDDGGLVAMWERGLAEAGVPLADGLQEGDVGIVSVVGDDGPVEVGAIFTGKRWAFLAPRGLFVTSIETADVLKNWRPCPS